jgi:hypothetical protein
MDKLSTNPLSTDDILDVATHIEKVQQSSGEFLAGKGLDFEKAKRAIEVLVPGGEGRRQAYQGGFILGLQLGAMRLDPIEFTPTEEDEKKECQCILCELERVAREIQEEP